MKLLLGPLVVALAAAQTSSPEQKCIRECEASPSCRSVFTNAATGECRAYDCTFAARADPDWTYTELLRPDRAPCPASVAAPTGGRTGGPLSTSTTGAAAPTANPNTAAGSGRIVAAAPALAAGAAALWLMG